jgi:hypothetical protein
MRLVKGGVEKKKRWARKKKPFYDSGALKMGVHVSRKIGL